MKRVLVTGGTGMLGSSLVPHLKAQDMEVVTHGRKSVSADFQADLSKTDEVIALLDHVNPSTIVNLVALTNVDLCEKNPKQSYNENVRPVENIVSWVKKHREVQLIQISTDHVYDGTGPHLENDVALTNYYAFSKYAAELTALHVGATIFRTNFFGQSLIPGRKSWTDWLLDSLQKRESIKLVTDVFFSPLSIRTLVEMIEIGIKNPIGGVYNLGSQNGMSKRDFAHLVAEEFGAPLETATDAKAADLGLRAYRPFDMRMNSSLFEKAFNYRLPTLEDEVKRIRKNA